MAINYTNLFTDVGKVLKYINVYLGYASLSGSLTSAFSAIATVLSGDSQYTVLAPISGYYSGFQDSATGWAGSLANAIDARFNDNGTVVSQLPIGVVLDTPHLLLELNRDMINNSQTIKANTSTLGGPSAVAGTVGDCQVLTTLNMDGVTAPRTDGTLASQQYLNVTSQFTVTSETMDLTCTADSYSGGVSEGAEVFAWNGGIVGQSAFDWRSEGSGNGPSVVVGNKSGLVLNNEFETYTVANTPDSWTLVSGTPGTHYLQDTVTFKRGLSSLALKGDGATAIELNQPPSTTLTPMKSYCIGCWLLGDATAAGSSALLIQFTGTGYTASSTEKISLNAAAIAALTSWTFYKFFISLPEALPSDFKLDIKATSLTNNAKIRVDGLVLVPVAWHGGAGVALAAGATPIQKGDRFTFSSSNNNAGLFQTLMRRWFKTQLNSSGSPSISDSLAS